MMKSQVILFVVSIPHRYGKNEDFAKTIENLKNVSIPHRYGKNLEKLISNVKSKKSFHSS